MERTLVIIKPDAVQRGLSGKILSRLEAEGLKLIGIKMQAMDRKMAEAFYHVHAGKPFFNSLVDYMSSAPVVTGVCEAEKAVERLRQLMGATDPKQAAVGTIRHELALDVEKNSVHGSDSQASAAEEIPFFFSHLELHHY